MLIVYIMQLAVALKVKITFCNCESAVLWKNTQAFCVVGKKKGSIVVLSQQWGGELRNNGLTDSDKYQEGVWELWKFAS